MNFKKFLRDTLMHAVGKLRRFIADRSIGTYWLLHYLRWSGNSRHRKGKA